MSSTINARKELLARVNEANWETDLLIESVVGELDCEREFVEKSLEHLKKRGEVYVVNGTVKRT